MYLRLVQRLAIGAACATLAIVSAGGTDLANTESSVSKWSVYRDIYPIDCFGRARVRPVWLRAQYGGARFHEGLDLYPIDRDRRGEPTDAVYAVLPGTCCACEQDCGAQQLRPLYCG